MERTTKHRILGILVMIGLVIILLPLFQSGGEPNNKTEVVKAPPFPDQSVQVTTPVHVAEESSMTPEQPAQESAESKANQTPNDLLSVSRPSVVNDTSMTNDTDKQRKVAEIEPTINPEEDDFKTQTTTTTTITKANDAVPPKTVIAKAKIVQSAKKTVRVIKQAPHINAPIRDNGLAELKNPAWVIQIGSFKNKANALRLVNQLRANGYRAFIQQTSSTFGDSTRVFVGPENKHNVARALASRLEGDMHIRGIVISYKPLAL
jgi:DedD protein